MSQYSDHEEEEEEEAAATAVEVTEKKEEERMMRRSSVEGSEETKAGAFMRRKRKSTTEGELSVVHLWCEQGSFCSSQRSEQLPQGRPPQQLFSGHCCFKAALVFLQGCCV